MVDAQLLVLDTELRRGDDGGSNSTSDDAAQPAPAPSPPPAPPAEVESTTTTTTTTTMAPVDETDEADAPSETEAPRPPYSNVSTSGSPTLRPLRRPNAAELRRLNQSRAQARLDCEVTPFGNWSACARTGDGMLSKFRSRDRTITNPQLPGGAACPELTEIEACTDDNLIEEEASE